LSCACNKAENLERCVPCACKKQRIQRGACLVPAKSRESERCASCSYKKQRIRGVRVLCRQK
jgi:hypothetical protein